MPKIPELRLTLGQVAWALARGVEPSPRLLAEMRYLRQVGIPFKRSEVGMGKGRSAHYDYFHLIELGVAFFGLRRGMRPKEIAKILVDYRKALRPIYEEAFANQPDSAVEAPWVKSRGTNAPAGLVDERFIRLHDRFSETPGKFDVVLVEETEDATKLFMTVERYPGERDRTLAPVSRLAIELVAWAKEAPVMKKGPR
ncbi:MAG: hypothetical protein AB7M05_08635 [Alphaproteobacteria bacterium]